MIPKFLLPILLVVLFTSIITHPVYGKIKIDLNGNVSQFTPSVLGDDEEQKPEEAKNEDKKEENKTEQKTDSGSNTSSEESKKQEEIKKETEKKEMEKVREQLKKNAEQAQKIRETNREIIKKLDEKTKKEKENSVEQIRLINKNNLNVSLASGSGEIEDTEDSEVEMETEHGLVSFKNSIDGKKMEINQGKASAETNLPLNIDPKTKKVSLESEGKAFEVKTLPEDILNSVANGKTFNASPSGSLEKFDIAIENGKVIYNLSDSKNEKFLGLFKVTIPKDVKLSGDTGEILEVKQNMLSKILDFLSI